MSTIIYILLAAGLVFFGSATLIAFCWAAKTRQLRNLDEGAKSIFDSGEPIGTATGDFSTT